MSTRLLVFAIITSAILGSRECEPTAQFQKELLNVSDKADFQFLS